MKKLFVASVLALCVVGLAGCPCPEKVDMKAVEINWKVMAPDYKALVEKSSDLTTEQKANRLEAIAELDKVIAGYEAAQGK